MILNEKSCGKSALFIAIEKCHDDIVSLLIQNGADVDSENE